MKGDFSRRTFDATKHYSTVLVEQGRLLTDADSDEEHRIQAHRGQQLARDAIGDCGAPLPDAGFGLASPDSHELHIGAGVFYAAGTLLENESEIHYTAQPDRFDVAWPLPEGRSAVVLDSWPRLITALDDPSIREVALGGPTTSSRERVVWQVRAVPVDREWACDGDLPAAEATTGTMAARAEPDAALPSPCLIPPQAGYTGLENQFYRVEVFRSGDAYDVVAAPDVFQVTGFVPGQPNVVSLADVGDLATGQPVEVIHTGPGSDPMEGAFGYVTAVDAGAGTVTLSAVLPSFEPGDAPVLRRVGAVFVASRDNGSVVTAIEGIDGTEVTVHDTGPDDVLGFAVGQLVELSDDRIELEDQPRRLHQIADIDQAQRVIILRTAAEPLAPGQTGVDAARHPKLRRWDAGGSVRFRPDGTGWIHLESGNQVRFTAGTYRSGDYWTFPARAATVDAASGTIEWPQTAAGPALLPPFGIERHRCVLGYVDVDANGTITNIEDCRNLFPPLTGMRTLLYVGGDGQEVDPGQATGGFIPLPGQLQVRVANGSFPVAGAVVRFTVEAGSGRVEATAPAADVIADADGLASCQWDLDGTEPHQQVSARLLTPAGVPIPHQVVTFHAILDAGGEGGSGRRGCCVSVGPGGDYETLDDALKNLLHGGQQNICVCLMCGDHKFGGGTFRFPPERALRLSLHGCGRGSRLHVTKDWLLSGWAVRVSELDLLMEPEVGLEIDAGTDVEISGCRVYGVRKEGALVGVRGFERLEVSGSVLAARRPDALDGPHQFFDGMDVLPETWADPDEDALDAVIPSTGDKMSSLSADDRHGMAKELRARTADAGRPKSRGEAEAYGRLADQIDDGDVAAIAAALHGIVDAAAVTRPAVCLDVSGGTGERLSAATRMYVDVTDNVIPGVVSFYGHGEADGMSDEGTIRHLAELLKDKAIMQGTGGDVHVRDNRIGRLALGMEMIKQLDQVVANPEPMTATFESLHLSNNVVDGVVTEVLARHVTVTSNDLTLAALPAGEVPNSGIVANVVADTAIYVGNHARGPVAGAAPPTILDATRTSAAAANLEVQIV